MIQKLQHVPCFFFFFFGGGGCCSLSVAMQGLQEDVVDEINPALPIIRSIPQLP